MSKRQRVVCTVSVDGIIDGKTKTEKQKLDFVDEHKIIFKFGHYYKTQTTRNLQRQMVGFKNDRRNSNIAVLF